MAADHSGPAGAQSGPVPSPQERAPGGSRTAAETTESVFASHREHWQRDSLRQELAACREELASMQALLNDLPRIFEGKFEARLQPLLEQKQRLLEGNRELQEQLLQLQPEASDAIAGRLMPAEAEEPADPQPEPAPGRERRHGWARGLRHAFGLADGGSGA